MKKIILFIICLFASVKGSAFTSKMDTLVERMLTNIDHVGLCVVISDRDSLLYIKTKGVRDLKSNRPVDSENDVFRIASVSKLFTAIAVLQQVEKGRLDLDADINEYLDFKIPETNDKQITLYHLLTHTAGFEDKIRGTYTKSIEQVQPLGKYLESNMPDIIYPPGEKTLYSNYSFALAGYIVERVSNEKFFDYITKFILRPLAMNKSFVYEDESYQDKIIPSYTRTAGVFKPFNMILYRNLSPSGMVNATPFDMGRILQLLLKKKAIIDRGILSEESIDLLITVNHRYSRYIQGYGLSMYEEHINGLQSMNIGGQLPSFSSQLSVINDSIGIFICANTSLNRPILSLIDSIAAILTPEPAAVQVSEYRAVPNPERYTGSYRWNRYNRQDLDYLRGLYANTKVLYYDEKGFFKFWGSSDEWIRQTSTLFREKNSNRHLLFDFYPDSSVKGIIGNLILDMPVYLEKFKYYETGKILDNTIGIMLVIFIAIPLIWGIIYLIKKIRKMDSRFDKTTQSKSLSIVVSCLFIYHLLLFRSLLANYIDFVTNESAAIIIMYILSYVMLLLLAAQIYIMVRDLITKNVSIFERITFGILIFNSIVYYLIMTKYNLFWFSL